MTDSVIFVNMTLYTFEIKMRLNLNNIFSILLEKLNNSRL